MRHVRRVDSRFSPREGVTLLELIVVLALLGLVLAIAAPSFIVPAGRESSGFDGAVEVARRAALLRGEPVTLSLARDGSWRVDGSASVGAAPIATGSLGGPTTTMRIHISPLGTCVPESVDDAALRTWNATTCAAHAMPNQRATP